MEERKEESEQILSLNHGPVAEEGPVLKEAPKDAKKPNERIEVCLVELLWGSLLQMYQHIRSKTSTQMNIYHEAMQKLWK